MLHKLGTRENDPYRLTHLTHRSPNASHISSIATNLLCCSMFTDLKGNKKGIVKMRTVLLPAKSERSRLAVLCLVRSVLVKRRSVKSGAKFPESSPHSLRAAAAGQGSLGELSRGRTGGQRGRVGLNSPESGR